MKIIKNYKAFIIFNHFKNKMRLFQSNNIQILYQMKKYKKKIYEFKIENKS